jgi:hypothetical protein
VNRLINAEEVFKDDIDIYKEIYNNKDKQTQKSLDEFIKICNNYMTISKL